MVFGITTEYRKSDEYKFMIKSVQEDYPTMPIYLIEMALTVHKNDPMFYKAALKSERMRLAKSVNKTLVEGCQSIQQKMDNYVLNTVTVSDPILIPIPKNISVESNNDKTKENLQDCDLQSEQTHSKQTTD